MPWQSTVLKGRGRDTVPPTNHDLISGTVIDAGTQLMQCRVDEHKQLTHASRPPEERQDNARSSSSRSPFLARASPTFRRPCFPPPPLSVRRRSWGSARVPGSCFLPSRRVSTAAAAATAPRILCAAVGSLPKVPAAVLVFSSLVFISAACLGPGLLANKHDHSRVRVRSDRVCTRGQGE